MKKKKVKIICPLCKSKMTLKTSSAYYYRDGKPRRYFECMRFPACKTRHSANADGSPTGFPVDQKTRWYRVKLHKLLAKIWDYNDPEQRKKMYQFLKHCSPKPHIAEMDKDELRSLEKIIIKSFFTAKK